MPSATREPGEYLSGIHSLTVNPYHMKLEAKFRVREIRCKARRAGNGGARVLAEAMKKESQATTAALRGFIEWANVSVPVLSLTKQHRAIAGQVTVYHALGFLDVDHLTCQHRLLPTAWGSLCLTVE